MPGAPSATAAGSESLRQAVGGVRGWVCHASRWPSESWSAWLLGSLRKLKLAGQNLKEIPENVGNLQYLRRLATRQILDVGARLNASQGWHVLGSSVVAHLYVQRTAEIS